MAGVLDTCHWLGYLVRVVWVQCSILVPRWDACLHHVVRWSLAGVIRATKHLLSHAGASLPARVVVSSHFAQSVRHRYRFTSRLGTCVVSLAH